MSNFYASHPEGPPPSYEEIAEAIQKFVEENPKKSQQAITSALRKDDKSFLVDQVKDIAATVASTKASFETVSLNLIRIDGLNRVAHGSLFSSIFASFFVPFFARFGGRFHHLAGENGMKITIKNDEKRLLWVLPPLETPKMSEKRE